MSDGEDRTRKLRSAAERRLADLDRRGDLASLPEARLLVHELRVYQAELEIQNEELQDSRHATEQLLERYTALFDFAPIGFLHVAQDCTIRASNFAAARLLGRTRLQLAGRDLAAFAVGGDRPAFAKFLGEVLTGPEQREGASIACEVTLFTGAHEVRVRVTGSAIAGPTALLAFEDVTARRAAEEALGREARRKDEFLAALSHELRNPLAPIGNALALLRLVPAGSEKAQSAQLILERQVSHLTHVVDDLLDVTRIARGKVRLQRERLELGELVRRTVEDHRAGLEAKGLRVRLDAQGPAWVDADATRLVQVLGNLIGNALKFTDAGGRVEIVQAREGAWAVVRVADTGIGIAPETADRLFEPFNQAPQTIDRSRGGLGLGLATAKGLVELQGGTVEVASDGPGRGSTFTVRLPLVQPLAPILGDGASVHAGPLRVLVVEDNADAAQTFLDLLELGGHVAWSAADGPAGVEAARAHHPDVVFCDLGLPGMSGYEVAKALRSDPATRGVWLVALSGYARPEDAALAAEAGFDRHLAKPAHPQRIEGLLAELAGRSRADRAVQGKR